MLQNSTSAVIDRALGGDSSFSDALRNSLVNTFAAAGFNWVGDISDESRLDLKEGRLPKVALHALMGGLAAEAAGGDFRIGALSAGVNEAVVGRLADQFDKMPEQERDKLLVMNSQILGVLTAAAAGGEAKDVQTGSWVAGSATSYNRLLHSTEKKALSAEAAELQKRLGKPGTDVSWEDLLLLAANAQVDQTEFARLDTLIKMYDPASPEGLHFLENLQTAQLSIEKLAGQNTVLKWEDGRAISANGSEVKAFQATGHQALDHGLFNTDSKWTQGGGGNWAGESRVVPEAWKQQFGERNAALYLREIGQVSSSPDEMKDLIGRVSTIATGGIKDVTIDLDVALALTGTGAALRALLAKRVSLATAEGAGGAVGKDALTEGGGAAGANPGAVSSGAENAALYPKLKEQLIQENLRNIAARDPRLAAAVNGSGTRNPNFSIGQGTASEADQLGRIWVGDGAKKTSDGLGFVSADGTRVYRPPALKDSPRAKTGVQANFESYKINPVTGQRVKVSNGHLDVAD